MALALAARPHTAVVPFGGPRGVLFVPSGELDVACADLRACRYLVATPGPAPRAAAIPASGELRSVVDDSIEGALALRGALPPGEPVGASSAATVRDQVFRALSLGVAGFAVAFPRLSGEEGALLHPEDGEVLSTWIEASRRAPVVLLLDERDRDARMVVPMRLGEIVPVSPAIPASARSGQDSDAPQSGEFERTVVVPVAPPIAPRARARESLPDEQDTSAHCAENAEVHETHETETAANDDARPAVEVLPALALESVPPPQALQVPPPPVLPLPAEAPRRGVLRKRPRLAPPPSEAAPVSTRTNTPPPELVASPTESVSDALLSNAADVSPAPRAVADTRSSQVASEAAARRVANASAWRAHAMELDRARGPKPVPAIEKLFAAQYVPLLGAAARGEIDATVRGVMDTWRTSFEHSYREAFAALRVTGKRPNMVFDAPDIAARIGRLNGARVAKLFLVDGMRFDIGDQVVTYVAERLAGRAVCVERAVLWAALPTTTATQMALLARGPEGLKDADQPTDPDAEIARGRAVGMVRRERVGSREVMKLDLCEARLRTAGPAYDERIGELAAEIGDAVVRYIETLPARTLLFVFGDHGFRLPASADGRVTGPATYGGVSPEEVLVPAQAWLVGGVH